MIIFTLAVIFVRPQIEGWSISRNFLEARAESSFAVLRYMYLYSAGQFPRVLEILPMALGSLLAGGAPIGWGLAYGAILVAKYFATKWALGIFLPPRRVIVLSILAVVMIPWEGQWREHNVPMQAAALFMILAVGTILRFRDEPTFRWAVLTPFWLTLSLASYEALIVVSMALPIVAVLAPGKSARPAVLARTLPLVLIPVTMFAAISAYLMMAPGSRISGLINFPHHPYDYMGDALKLLYSTALLQSSMTLVALPLYVFTLSEASDRKDRQRLIALAIFILCLLPLSAAPFMTSYPYLNDVERVGLPVGFGFFLLCTLISLVAKAEIRSSVAMILVSCTTLAAGTNAYASWRPYGEFQRPVLDQVKRLLKTEEGKRVIVRDMTNRLGDVFTFQHQVTFRDALRVSGVDATLVDLCLIETPANRFHPQFGKLEFPLSPVPVCLPPTPGEVVLDVQWKDRRPLVVRAQ